MIFLPLVCGAVGNLQPNRNRKDTTTMDISKAIGDLDAQKNGVEVQYTDGTKVLIAYARSKAYRNYLAEQLVLARRANRNRDLPPEVMDDITTRAMARHLVKGWEQGKFSVGEQPFDYSPENALELLQKSVHFRDFVSDESSDDERFGIFKKDEEGSAKADTKSGPSVEPQVGA